MTKPSSLTVSFAPLVAAYLCMHISDYSYEEKTACWYNQKELKSIHVDARNTLLVMTGAGPVNRSIMCMRGLEYLTPEASTQRKLIREDARHVVFKEQDLQMTTANKIYNPVKVAHAYAKKSERSQIVARLMARVDRKVVIQLDLKGRLIGKDDPVYEERSVVRIRPQCMRHRPRKCRSFTSCAA